GKGRFFGPYPNAWAVRETIQILQRVFRLRTCEDSVYANRSRPCLLYQIGRCSAPCVNLISDEDYKADVERAVRFLDGQAKEVMQDIDARMRQASDALDFEKAAVLRDQMGSLAKVLQQQSMEKVGNDDVDVIALASAGGRVCVNLAMIRGGRHLGDKPFFPSHANDDSPGDVLAAFVSQHYVESSMPAVLVCSHPLPDPDLIALVAERTGVKARVIIKPQGVRKTWLEQAMKNAEMALARLLTESSARAARSLALASALEMDTDEAALDALHVECF